MSWGVLARLWSGFEPEWVAFVLSVLIVYAYAFVLPEPPGYDDARARRLTSAEAIFGFFNVLIIFATVLGIKDGFGFG